MYRRWRGWRAAVLATAAAGMLLSGMAGPGLAAGTATASTGTATAGTGPAGSRQSPAFVTGPRAAALPPGQRRVCGEPSRPGQMACQAVAARQGAAAPAVTGVPAAGYGPSDLRNAYGLGPAAARNGTGRTVAVVDAFNDPYLVRNLASYRSHFRLPACTLSTHCLRVVNQSGHSSPLPRADAGWAMEESLDLDMVSAICPRCHILLVEAGSASVASLGAAENTAVRLGARYVSNSWSGPEFVGQDAYDHDFSHRGVAITVASGDAGYGAQYPADLQYVTSVGGTRLVRAGTTRRGWSETVWGSATDLYGGTGSGCSALEAKPSWQRADDTAPGGCLNRTENDVAADASLGTGVAVYDTYQTGARLFKVGGTSAATPIISATYALAGSPKAGSYPAAYPYRHATDLNKVTSGLNGVCEAGRPYLCHGEPGYNGPTGLGTPKGTGGFSPAGVNPVTVPDPGSRDVRSGAGFRLTVAAADTDRLASSLSYTATGLPPGLRIASAPQSLNGLITGTLPPVTAATGYHVTVTATDHRVLRSNSARFEIYVIPSLTTTSTAPGPGLVGQEFAGSDCLSAPAQAAGGAVDTRACDAPAQKWQFTAGAQPGAAGTLELGGATGLCLGLSSGDKAVLDSCAGASAEQWQYLPAQTSQNKPLSVLYSPASARCLTAGSPGTQATATRCSNPATSQGWALPASAVVSGTGQCLSDSAATPQLAPCSASDTSQQWLPGGGGNLQAKITGTCLAASGGLDGTGAVLADCGTADSTSAGVWLPGPGGELINAASGKCLNAVSGKLQLSDCYGLPGEIWALN